MRVFATVLAATMLLSAPVAFGQTDPNTTPTAPAASEPSSPAPTTTGSATPATPDATQGQPQATDADHQVTCHYVESTESRLRRRTQRVCGTRQQWESMQDQNARDMHRMGEVQSHAG
jgi:hypothetical protein